MAISHIVSVIDLVAHPSIKSLSENVVPGSPFSGDGVLTRPGLGFGVNAYGIAWSLVEIPPALGVKVGRIPVWHDRLVQFGAFYNGVGFQYVGEMFDVHTDPGFWLWREPFPTQIAFTCLPGVVAQFRWLLLLVGVSEAASPAARDTSGGERRPRRAR